MKLFDSHCHLDDPVLFSKITEVMENARRHNVVSIIAPGIDVDTSVLLIDLANRFESIYAAVGIHPNHSVNCNDKMLKTLVGLTKNEKVRAWGEIGLDFNRPWCPPDIQEKWFLRQLEMSLELNLPVILHERETAGRLLFLLKSLNISQWKGVIHCFSGTESELEEYLELGLHIGITGIITHSARGRALRVLLPKIPLHRILIETDAPYLIPSPLRNQEKHNEPAFVLFVLKKIAEVLQEKESVLADQFWENTRQLFQINAN